MANHERSISRGRDAFVRLIIFIRMFYIAAVTYIGPQTSTGRGGIGNVRQQSVSRDARRDSV
ncbi:hypothetical protein BDZ97DRAFT_1815795 [Flammula alnicola]|nr:hypothetical protein BDZ97DRAFT_1815795 [Flammula alnicola]